MKKDNENRHGHTEAYPKPTQTDEQLKNQPEFIDQQPNDFKDKSISDLPVRDGERQSDDLGRGTKRDD